MRTIHRLTAIAAIVVVATSCATKVPPADTFSPEAWARVEALTPGTRVEVRYVSTTTGKPLRQHFDGKLLTATGDVLEVETKHGVQRLLPQRVLRIAVVGSEPARDSLRNGALVGATAAGLAAFFISRRIDENGAHDDSAHAAASLLPALVGAGIGAVIDGLIQGSRRDTVFIRRGP
jgi:hypothetical protein